MPEFQLDTSGKVDNGPMLAGCKYGIEWTDLDAFTQGYIEAMFFTSEGTGVTTEEFWKPAYQEDMIEGRVSGELPGDVGFGDLAPETLQLIMRNCRDFQRSPYAAPLLARAYEREGYSAEQAGSDFWFTRNGHGVGYWDRKPLEAEGLGDELSELVGHGTIWGEVLMYFGADNKVHQS